MLMVGLILALGAYFFSFNLAAKGILCGMPGGIFNYFLAEEFLPLKVLYSSQAAREVSRRLGWVAALRWGLSLCLLLWASSGGAQFLIGVCLGLALQMLTYLYEAGWLLIKGVR